MNDIIFDAITRRLFPGCAVALFNGDNDEGEVVCRGAYHFFEGEPYVRMVQTKTLYDISSLTKVLTTIGNLRLIDQGVLNLDEPVAATLPFKGEDDIQKMSLRDILTCRTDFVLPDDLRQKGIHLKDQEGKLRFFKEATLRGPLGTMFRYGNPAAFVAGKLIDTMSGIDLETSLLELVFDPLEMKDTSFKMSPFRRQHVAPTQVVVDPSKWQYGEVQDPMSKLFPYPIGIAGIFSNVTDMLKATRFLATGNTPQNVPLISPALWSDMVSDQYAGKEPVDGVEHHYGLGIDMPGPGYVSDPIFCQRGLVMPGNSGTFIFFCPSWYRSGLLPRAVGGVFLANARRDMANAVEVHRMFRRGFIESYLDSITE